MENSIIVLAAGEGTRFNSNRPKVLHELGGVPMLSHVLDVARVVASATIHVVVGDHATAIQAAIDDERIRWHRQNKPLGTGHALKCARSAYSNSSRVLILYGDVPFVSPATLKTLLALLDTADLAVLTRVLHDPTGYGRIIRNQNDDIVGIIEQRDATTRQAEIQEVNTGVMAVRGKHLPGLLDRIDKNNAQNEYYLTDCIGLAAASDMKVTALQLADAGEALGINTLEQLEMAERELQRRRVQRLQEQGVTVRDAKRLDIRGEVTAGRDVCIDVNVVLEGRVEFGDGVQVGANCILRDVSLGADTKIEPFSLLETSQVGKACLIGPFARIRPQVKLGNAVKIGNFVEVKKSNVADNSKISHLSYIGDTTVGHDTNVGAGTITCNYDGARKHHTIIGDRVFIGSGTQLVAPVKIADDATIGAGSTITHDTEADTLTLSRSKQKTVAGWRRPVKEEKK